MRLFVSIKCFSAFLLMCNVFFIKKNKYSINPVMSVLLFFTFLFFLFRPLHEKGIYVWKIMFFLASLSGKNIIFSLDSGKILSILRFCREICLSKVCTYPVISLSNILSERCWGK